jgi:DNA-binding protein HU-beta
MTKEELVKSLSKKFDVSNAKAADIIKHVLDEIKTSLTKNKPVAFIGFGSFSIRKRAARNGVNPKTGEKIKIPARKAVHFSVGKALKESINNKK